MISRPFFLFDFVLLVGPGLLVGVVVGVVSICVLLKM